MNAQSTKLKDFDVIEEIGKGAFGSVFKAKRIKDGQIYAVKKVLIGKLQPKEKENSLNEIRILASVNHKNVVSYKESFFDQEACSICTVMEFAELGDLEKKINQSIKNKTYLQESEIMSIFVQIVLGLKALHDKKIMHRDIKAANIFMFNNDLVKIGDLNVSKVVKRDLAHTQTGTPYYASPEVWNDKPYDYKSDIWSLGCLLYEMTTLKAPFRGTTMKGVYEKVIKGVYSPIPTFYSSNLASLISLMLDLKAINRPSCEQILQFVKEKMKNLKLSINIFNQDQATFSTISEIPSINKSFTSENLLKTLKFPKRVNELNTILPKSKYYKRRIVSAYNLTEKDDTYSKLNKLSSISNLSKLDLTNPNANTKEVKSECQDRSINSYSASIKTNIEVNTATTQNKNITENANEDPILKAINKPIILRRNYISKIRNKICIDETIQNVTDNKNHNKSLNINLSSIEEKIQKIKDLKLNNLNNLNNLGNLNNLNNLSLPPTKIQLTPIYSKILQTEVNQV